MQIWRWIILFGELVPFRASKSHLQKNRAMLSGRNFFNIVLASREMESVNVLSHNTIYNDVYRASREYG